MTKFHDEKYDRNFFLSNVLFSSLFFLGIFKILQFQMGLLGPMLESTFLGEIILRVILSLLSLVGVIGILISFRRLGRKGIWAYPALAVTFSLLIGSLGYLVLILNYMQIKNVSHPSILYNFLDCIFIFGLLASTAFIFLGYGHAGCKMARITAAVPALFGVLSIPYVLQTLSRATRIMEGTPVRSEDATLGIIYLLIIMPIMGFIIIAQAYYCMDHINTNDKSQI